MTQRMPDRIRREVETLGPWFHNIDLGGVATAPDHFLGDYPAVKWRRFALALPADLRGSRARYRLQRRFLFD
jgi:tRNA (mo5U34)-methyltransferase